MRRDTPKSFDILFQMRLLFYSLIVPAAVGISYILGTLLPNDVSEPGSSLMQSLAIIGTLLIVITFYGVLSKRFGKPGRIGTVIHIISANIGTILVIVHSGGTIFATPGSLIILLFIIMLLGGVLRIVMPLNFSKTFGTKLRGFTSLEDNTRKELRKIISSKEDLLAQFEPNAQEGLFSLRLQHWVQAPLLAYRYQKLEKLEENIIGYRNSVKPIQAYCRRLHQIFSWLLLIGITVHIITVTFFATYVADGRPIYWGHIEDWG